MSSIYMFGYSKQVFLQTFLIPSGYDSNTWQKYFILFSFVYSCTYLHYKCFMMDIFIIHVVIVFGFLLISTFGSSRKEMFYLTMHSTHFIYGYMVSDIWQSTSQIVREETHFHHMGYSFRLRARVLLYAPYHRQDCTYHSLCYASCGALAGMRNSSMGPPHEGSIR